MINGKFQASDFGETGTGEHSAEVANALLPTLKAQWLAELLRDAPVAYGKSPEMVPLALPWDWSTDKCIDSSDTDGLDTYQARLICIEVIK